MKKPFQSGDELLSDIRKSHEQLSKKGGDGFAWWWLGQSGFLIQFRAEHLLFDPYLSDSLTKKYAETDKPHVRITERVIEPEKLDFINVVTSSHNHTDHLDAETLIPLIRINPEIQVVVPRANLEFAANRLQVETDRLSPIDGSKSLKFGEFELIEVPAAHEEIERDENGNLKCIGLIAKFGKWTIYHSGDTILYDGMQDILKEFSIDLAFLPINGRAPKRRVAGNLSSIEASELAHSICAKCVIPCHFDMFEFNTASPDGFVDHCERISQRYKLLGVGQSLLETMVSQ